MKKILIFLIILSNLTFGTQNFSANSKVLDKIEAEVTKELERGNNEKAISILKKSISENPEKSVFLKIVLGMIYIDMERNSEAEKEFNEAVELQKKYPFFDENGKKQDVKLIIGSIYFGAEDTKNALKWLKQVDDKDFNEILDNQKGLKDYILGILNYKEDNIEEAKKNLLKSYIYDEDGLSENILGQIYIDEGNQKEAQKWFLKSASKGNSGGQANLGFLYQMLGDKEKALKWMTKALETAKKEKNAEEVKEIQEMIESVKNN
ncbi:tetratricopeptide repeat protein [Leptotrichia sp. oral taxon 218]|uniref:tetratricopeptide repeat protein n=1 Tax=Leptotrichia sp. oral taxon 218 TaxID=712361 RepID=UPI001B8AA38E|nr:tetratricopeptide repeat protein [Leptotrichia sp. oral taxon 218]QUB95770.1 tetratricopeptide repeat protein [Leptotrichia sp. oral taxon 218]